MLMVVGHHACIVVYDGQCIQKEIMWKNDTCAMIDNHKHVSRSMMVDAHIQRCEGWWCMHGDRQW